MQVDMVNTELAVTGSVEVPDSIFATTVNEAVLWAQVRAQRASSRRGTHCTKRRGEVRGGGAKPHKQKGTGRARQGSSRAPNHVGGGAVFGPKPRNYAYRLPKTARRVALCSALALRASAQALVILEEFAIDVPRTKTVLAFLERLGMQSVLLVDADNAVLKRSTRNIQAARYLDADGLNVYDILNHRRLVLTRRALDLVVQRLAMPTRRGRSSDDVEHVAA